MEAGPSSPTNETRSLPTDRLVDDFKLVAQRAGQKARDGARAAAQAPRLVVRARIEDLRYDLCAAPKAKRPAPYSPASPPSFEAWSFTCRMLMG